MSGGPIINDIGEVIGVTTLVQYRVKNNWEGYAAVENQPVALPIYLVRELMQENHLLKNK